MEEAEAVEDSFMRNDFMSISWQMFISFALLSGAKVLDRLFFILHRRSSRHRGYRQ